MEQVSGRSVPTSGGVVRSADATRKLPKPEIPKRGHFLRKHTNRVKAGIVGFTNSGKTSLFNVLTGSNAPVDAHPFSTIEPNYGRTTLPDDRLDWLSNFFQPKTTVASPLSVIDCPGLGDRASRGDGLGWAFLSNLQQCDTLIAVARGWQGAAQTHLMDSVNPVRDLELVVQELVAKDIEIMRIKQQGMQKTVEGRQGGTQAVVEFRSVERILNYLLIERRPIRLSDDWTDQDVAMISRMRLLTAKEMLYLVNLPVREYLAVIEDGIEAILSKPNWLKQAREMLMTKFGENLVLPFSAEFEERLGWIRSKGTDALAEYFTVNPTHSSMREDIIRYVFQSLDLIEFFTCGPEEVRSWTAPKGTLAPAAAGVIHADFEIDFISVEVESYTDLRELESEEAVKREGRLQQQGKKYIVQNGDICFFKFRLPNYRPGANLTNS